MLEKPHAPRPHALAPEIAAFSEAKAINLARENAAVIERLRAAKRRDDAIVIVPGYTPINAETPVRLHEIAQRRLDRACEVMREHGAEAILVSGGNVHPDHTPYNEAMEMKRHLLGPLGLSADQVAIDPYARHSTTNLRNAGRFMLSLGLREALVVTSFGQGFYFGAQDISSFRLRSDRELGYTLGELKPNLSFTVIHFRPSEDVWRKGDDPLDP